MVLSRVSRGPFLFCLVILMVMISPVSILSQPVDGSGSEERSSSNDEGTRMRSSGGRLPGSSLMFNSSDRSWVYDTDNLELDQGSHYRMDDNSYREIDRFTADPGSSFLDLSSDSCMRYEDLLLVAYIRMKSSPDGYSFMLAGSMDGGSSWRHEEVIFMEGVSSPSVGMDINEDKLFFTATCIPGSVFYDDIHVVSTPLVNWANISRVDPVALSHPGSTSRTTIVGMEGRSILFSKASGYMTPYYFIYDNGTWSGPSAMPVQTFSFAPVVVDKTIGQDIVFQYLDTSTPRMIREMTSGNGGGDWNDPVGIASSSRTMSHMASVCSNSGKIHTVISYSGTSHIGYIGFEHGTTTQITDLYQGGANGLDGDDHEVSIGCAGDDDVLLAFESSNGMISMGRSSDGGRSFSRIDMGDGTIHSPSVSRDLSAMVFMNGTSLQIGTLGPVNAGVLVTEPILVHGVYQWKEIALSLGGATRQNSFSFSIGTPSGDDLYPGSGTISVHDSPAGKIGGHHFQHIVDITPLNNGQVPERIVIRFHFDGSSGEDPTLFSFLLNFTVSYPYIREIDDQMCISSFERTKISPMGLVLVSGSSYGSAVIGPFFRGEDMPHHLWAKGNFLGPEDTCKFSIIASDHGGSDPFMGFNEEKSDPLNRSSTFQHIKWGRLNLGDLHDSVRSFHIKVTIRRTGSLSPVLTSLKLGYSTPPSIDSITVEDPVIHREGTTSIHVWVSDAEEPPSHMDLEVEMKAHESTQWSDDLLSDPLWKDGYWLLRLQTGIGTVPGPYSVRAVVFDSFGEESEPEVVDPFIDIKNNIPTPPMVKVTPEVPLFDRVLGIEQTRWGDDVETPVNELVYNIYLFRNGEMVVEEKNSTFLNITFPDHRCQKGDSWEVHVTTWDGLHESEPFGVDFVVGNSDPVVDYDGSPLVIDEDAESPSFDISDWFHDPDAIDTLQMEVSGPEKLSPELDGNILSFTPAEDHYGTEWVRIDVTDGTSGDFLNITVEIDPVNDPPVWNHVADLEVDEGKWIKVPINAEDPHDEVMVRVTINEFVEGLVPGDNLRSQPNGTFMFRPDNSMVGKHLVEMEMDDGEMIVSYSFNITVNNVNQVPSAPDVVIEEEKHTFYAGELIHLSASSTDVDSKWGDSIAYDWSSSLDGDLGSGPDIQPSLSVGEHEITITATDSQGGTNSTTINMEILPDQEGKESVMRTWLLYTISGGLSLFIGLVLALIIALMVIKKGKGKKETDAKERVGGETVGQKVPGTGKDLPSAPTERIAPPNTPSRELPPMNGTVDHEVSRDVDPPNNNSDRSSMERGTAEVEGGPKDV